jgi:DNA-binding LacI/PurR family transcriptional regulator
MMSEVEKADTKVKDIYKYLRTLALETGPEAQLPTVRTLCEDLGTTRVTLREALALLEAEDIIYTKNRQGIFVSPRIHHKSIGILFSSYGFAAPASPFWSMLWMQMEQEVQVRATFKNETCTFYLAKPTDDPFYSIPETIETILQTERVDGVLSVGFHSRGEGTLNTGKIPCVTFAGAGVCTVHYDPFAFARLAVETLIRQHCHRIGWWAFHFPLYPLEQMEDVQIFRQLLQDYKKPLYPELIRVPHLLPSQTMLSLQEQGYLLAREVFEGPASAWPDGLIIANDMMTDGALVAFDELGIRIGHDLQVVTHANVGSPMLFGRTKQMTLIEHDPALMAQAMFSTLDILMAGQKPEEMHTKIHPRLRQ